jgi:hypothetical protein
MSSRRWRLLGGALLAPRPPGLFFRGWTGRSWGGVPSGQPPLPGRGGRSHDPHLLPPRLALGEPSAAARAGAATRSRLRDLRGLHDWPARAAGGRGRASLLDLAPSSHPHVGRLRLDHPRAAAGCGHGLAAVRPVSLRPSHSGPADQGSASRLSEAGGRAGGAGRGRRPGSPAPPPRSRPRGGAGAEAAALAAARPLGRPRRAGGGDVRGRPRRAEGVSRTSS